MNMNEISAYLANASYVISLGGPPLADLKYGIIVLPVGEESLLFGPKPNHVMSREFLDAIDDANRDYDRTQRLRDPDKDSADFLRRRFDDDFSSRPAESHHHIEIPREEETLVSPQTECNHEIRERLPFLGWLVHRKSLKLVKGADQLAGGNRGSLNLLRMPKNIRVCRMVLKLCRFEGARDCMALNIKWSQAPAALRWLISLNLALGQN
ncbi:hypothetical protein NUW58_g6797 [Xylaria curta]|uniref:Uncharacterized protein n=1 Tax=Xylaria curta TaxID=42375 RepID=A0ACC1NQ03_9PEZI|nr:hypothetical protein NUW58_g6797 [Xylaria curta]